MKILHSSESNEWYTPPGIVESAREFLGGIDLDPASCLEANEIVKAEIYYNKDQNGLLQPWEHKRIFVNPPGGRGQVALWWQKAIDTLAKRDVCIVFVLFSMNYLQTLQRSALFGPLEFKVCVPRKRIAYISPDGKRCKSPPHPSAIVGLGGDLQAFRDAFWHLGNVVVGPFK